MMIRVPVNGLPNDETEIKQTYPPGHGAAGQGRPCSGEGGGVKCSHSADKLLPTENQEGAGPDIPSFSETHQSNKSMLFPWGEAQSITLAHIPPHERKHQDWGGESLSRVPDSVLGMDKTSSGPGGNTQICAHTH